MQAKGCILEPNYLQRTGKPKLAYHYTKGENQNKAPLVMFLGGYRSDMNGTKANYFEQQCIARGQSYLRFDYSGHGQSEGIFEECLLGDWLGDAVDMLDHASSGPVVLVGSSMGGWLALLLAKARAEHIKGLIGIAAAPDFTEDMYEKRLSSEQQKQLMTDGMVYVENDYSDEPYAFSKRFYEEAKTHLLLHEKQSAAHPMRLIQGKDDVDVPWETAVKIQKTYGLADEDIMLVEGGNHSLSRPEDLELIDSAIKYLSGF